MTTQTESRSTGPRSKAGKQSSSRYARTIERSADRAQKILNELQANRHAAFVLQDVISASIQERFAAYRARLEAEFLPANENERTYFERYAFLQFQMLQAQTLEADLLAEIMLDPSGETKSHRLAILSRYARTIERSADRAQKILNELQANRHAAFVLQDVITHAHNSDVIVPPASPVRDMLQPKNFKMDLETLSIAIIHREKQRQYEVEAKCPDTTAR